MVVGVLRLELFLQAPQSLKEKRSIVNKVLGRCRQRWPVSAAETGLQDLWQRAELGFVMVGRAEDPIRSTFEQIEAEIESLGLALINEEAVEFLHY
jgi:uncharacterized protein